MTGLADSFSVGVRSSDGTWPDRPVVWSYSSLREANECPKRWMLSRATYPDLWNNRGYPPRANVAALMGEVIHGTLEILIRTLRTSGCSSLSDPAVVKTIKQLGGYTKLVEEGIEVQLRNLIGNPRMTARIEHLRTALRIKVPDMRQRIQLLLARAPFRAEDSGTSTGSQAGRWPLQPGIHPEVELRATDVKMMGRADLIEVTAESCSIIDYKTGAVDPHHADQLRLYALMWLHDSELNPKHLPVEHLTLSYPSHNVDVSPPTPDELEELSASISMTILDAEDALQRRPPPARPERDVCRMCGVRQLCDVYWSEVLEGIADSDPNESEWFDFEGQVVEQNGPRSWKLVGTKGGTSILLRTSSDSVSFDLGQCLRILNLHRQEEPEVLERIGVLTQASETFEMTPN
jgi:PD-(D/E)XK nuclease superfamily protein